MAMRGVRRDTPSGKRLARFYRINRAADEDLRDAVCGVRSELRTRVFDASGKAEAL